MSYLLRANQLTLNQTVEAKLISYFENIPQAFWESLENFDANAALEYAVSHEVHMDDRMIDHQLYISEKFKAVPGILEKDNLLTKLGYDTVSLGLSELYEKHLQALNEDGVLGKVWNFAKEMVTDKDPAVTALNIFQLVLDLIGLVPFSWGAMPIDVVANALSALISVSRGNWFSAILSIMMCVDVSKASAFVNASFKPVAKYIDPVLKFIMRPAEVAGVPVGSVVELEKGIASMKDNVIRVGGKGLLDNVITLFKNIGKFFVDIVANLLEAVTRFLTFVFRKVPGVSQMTEKIITAIEKIRISARGIGTNVEKTVQVLTKTGTTADKAAATALVDTISAEIKSGEIYTKLIEKQKAGKITGEWADVYLKHKIQNKLIGEPQALMNAIERAAVKDPAIANQYMAQFRIKPNGTIFQKIVKIGDEYEVKRIIDFATNNNLVKKMMTPRELEALNVFKKNPKALIDGAKDFEVLSAKMVEIENRIAVKGANLFTNSRMRPLRRLTYFILNMLWKRYGSASCIYKALKGGKGEGSDPLKNTAALALAPAVVTEAEAPAQIPMEEIEASIFKPDPTPEQMEQLKRQDPEAYEEIKKSMDEVEANKAKLAAANKKDDCKLQATIVNSLLPRYIPYKTGLGMGALPYNYDKAAQDTYHKNLADNDKQILDALGLGSTIDVQHALDNADPVTRVYFADVYDYQNGYVKVTPEQFESNREKVIQEMIRDGEITEERAKEIREILKKSDQTGQEPAEVTRSLEKVSGSTDDSGPVKESLIKVKYLNK